MKRNPDFRAGCPECGCAYAVELIPESFGRWATWRGTTPGSGDDPDSVDFSPERPIGMYTSDLREAVRKKWYVCADCEKLFHEPKCETFDPHYDSNDR